MYSNLIKSEAPLENYKDLENYMKGIIERHADSVPLPAGRRDELKDEILIGMKHTWHLVSLSPCMVADHIDCKVRTSEDSSHFQHANSFH
jgi:hypothetical protein